MSVRPPTLGMYVAALAGNFPLLFWISWELGYLLSIPYFLLHLLSGPLAVRLQHDDARSGSYKRWLGGLFVTVGLSVIKTSAVMRCKHASLMRKTLFYVSSSLWECSNGALVFGGRKVLFDQYGIDSFQKALVAVLSPGQVKFVKEPRSIQSWLIRTVHLTCFLVAYLILRAAFSRGVGGAIDNLKTILEESYPLLLRFIEAEAMVLLLSCVIMVWDLPCHVWQLAMIRYPVEVVYPYGAVYMSTSMRSFWSKWSRPASQLVRYAIYYPLGGGQLVNLSVPVLFALNAVSHYDVSNALIGDRAETAWNQVFGVLGVATVLEMHCNRYFDASMSISYRVLRTLVTHGTLMFAAYTLVHKCLHLNLSSFLYTEAPV